MAVVALTNEYLAINASEVSSLVKSAVLNVEAETLDSTTMGDTWREATPGVKSGTLVVEFLDDFADSSLDDDLWQLFNTVTTFEVRPVNTTVGVNNPKYTGSVHVSQLPFGGAHGQLAGKSVTWPTSGAVTRAEA